MCYRGREQHQRRCSCLSCAYFSVLTIADHIKTQCDLVQRVVQKWVVVVWGRGAGGCEQAELQTHTHILQTTVSQTGLQ